MLGQLCPDERKRWKILPNGLSVKLADNKTVLQFAGKKQSDIHNKQLESYLQSYCFPHTLHTLMIAKTTLSRTTKWLKISKEHYNNARQIHCARDNYQYQQILYIASCCYHTRPGDQDKLVWSRQCYCWVKNSNWSQSQIKQVINGSIAIENCSKEPDFHKKQPKKTFWSKKWS